MTDNFDQLRADLAQQVRDGLITQTEADRILAKAKLAQFRTTGKW